MSTIRIGRLDHRYRVPAGGEPPAAVQARLDRVAREELAAALGAAASHLPQASGEEVWLVRDLDVALTLDLHGTSAGALAAAWSGRLAVALREALAPGGAAVVRFRSPAAWTAAFVAERAAGTAWDRWYFGAFASLRALPAGRAIAEAIVREPAQAAGVMAELAGSGDLELVLLQLGEGDARRVTAALAPGGRPAGAGGRALAEALARLEEARRPSAAPHLPGSVLRLLTAALRAGVALPPGAAAVAAAVVLLAEVAGAAAEVAPALERGGWVAALRAAGLPARAVTADGVAAGETLRALAASGAAGWLGRLTAALGGAAPAGRAAALATPFGGLLLVWPVFGELWPAAQAAEGAEAARWRVLVAARLFGLAQRAALLRDPVLALLCGLVRPPVPDALEAAGQSLPWAALAAAAAGAGGPAADPAFFGSPRDPRAGAADAFAAAVLHRFAARLPGFAGSSPGHLVRNFLAVPASLRLGDDGVWAAAVGGPPLQVVLRMAGLSRLRVEAPWLAVPVTADLRWG